MKRKISIILCFFLTICMLPTASAYAAGTVKARSVSVSPSSIVISVGDVAQLKASTKPAKATGKLTWSSSNKAVATVSGSGLVQGVSEGTAKITVRTSNKKKLMPKSQKKQTRHQHRGGAKVSSRE